MSLCMRAFIFKGTDFSLGNVFVPKIDSKLYTRTHTHTHTHTHTQSLNAAEIINIFGRFLKDEANTNKSNMRFL